MSFVTVSKNNSIATMTLNRGKVHALNDEVIDNLNESLDNLEKDSSVRAIILTGSGKFFSFGFDIPQFMSYSKEAFTDYLINFTTFLNRLFLFPKPVVGALNGHTIAGGCMLATACDYRIMVSGKARIALNEITFGASVFAGSVDILKHCAGPRSAEQILKTGAMFSAEEALELGLVNQISSEEKLSEDAQKIAAEYAQKDPAAFAAIKKLLRLPVVDSIGEKEIKSIRDFIEIWYSESTREQLKKITIRE